MKKLFTLLLGLCLASPALAQKPKFTPDYGATLDGKTIVKANLTSPIFHEFSFAAERILTKGLSFQLGVATMPKEGLPFASAIDKAVDIDGMNIQAFRLGSFHLTPELRWYTGGGYGHGFYLMAYYRYQKYSISGYDLSYTIANKSASGTKDVNVGLQGDFNTNTLGFGLGAQWLFGRNKNIVLDWNILGLHAGRGKFNLTGNIAQAGLTAEEIADLRHELGHSISGTPSVNIGENDIQIDQQAVRIKNIGTPWGFIRASLSVGFRF